MPEWESTWSLLLLAAVIGYGFGSVPSGMVLTRALGLGDLRQIGSGNIGATNVLRTGNKAAAAATLLLDALKGVLAVIAARLIAGEDAAQLAALTAFLGHCYPVWLGFKGGKGVATFLGVWLALATPVGIACCLTWLAAAAIIRISSASALVAAVSVTFWAAGLGHATTIALAVAMTLLVFWRHKANIVRLRAGTEPKIGRS